MGSFWGVVVWAPWALDGKITPTGCGRFSMIKKNVAGVGMCGCMTSLLPTVNLTWKMSIFKGYVLLFWSCGGGP